MGKKKKGNNQTAVAAPIGEAPIGTPISSPNLNPTPTPTSEDAPTPTGEDAPTPTGIADLAIEVDEQSVRSVKILEPGEEVPKGEMIIVNLGKYQLHDGQSNITFRPNIDVKDIVPSDWVKAQVCARNFGIVTY